MNKMKITLYDFNDNDEVEFEVPALWAICSQCEGNGRSLPRGLRGHFYTQEDFDRGGDDLRDFCDGLSSGQYDEDCAHCDCKGKVLVPDVEKITEPTRSMYVKQIKDEMEHRAICRSEAAMMAGMAGDMESYNLIRSER